MIFELWYLKCDMELFLFKQVKLFAGIKGFSKWHSNLHWVDGLNLQMLYFGNIHPYFICLLVFVGVRIWDQHTTISKTTGCLVLDLLHACFFHGFSTTYLLNSTRLLNVSDLKHASHLYCKFLIWRQFKDTWFRSAIILYCELFWTF